jgi:DNA modification methylase
MLGGETPRACGACQTQTGSTLIACERRGRAARQMELDPRYADVICRRFQEYTGKQAVLDGDGRTFDEIAKERIKEAA